MAIGGEEDIFWLEVSEDDTVLTKMMEMFEGERELSSVQPDFFKWEAFFRFHVKKRSPPPPYCRTK
jgi:hypothetical protein